MNKKPTNSKLTSGSNFLAFTLVELLIVVAILSILAGVTLSIINSRVARNKAYDSAAQSNLDKVVQGIEAFYAAEGRYPTTTAKSPLVGADSVAAAAFISTWPNGNPAGSTYSYYTTGTGATSTFGVYVNASNSANIYKYYYTWDAIRLCAATSTSGSTCAAPVAN